MRRLLWNFILKFLLFFYPSSKISKLLLVHELCISEGLEEHKVPTTPHPSCSAAGRSGVVCVSRGLGGGVYRHPSVCLLHPPAGRHGTPCRRCSAPLPLSLRASLCMSHTNTPKHTRGTPVYLLTHQSNAYLSTHTQLKSTFCISAYNWIITTVQARKGQKYFQPSDTPKVQREEVKEE